MPERTNCTVASLRAVAPCLDCLSFTELELVELFLWGLMSYWWWEPEPEDLSELMADATCFQCLSKKQIKAAQVAAMYNLVKLFFEFQEEELTIQDIMDYMKCARCATPRQRDALLTYFICEYWNWGDGI